MEWGAGRSPATSRRFNKILSQDAARLPCIGPPSGFGSLVGSEPTEEFGTAGGKRAAPSRFDQSKTPLPLAGRGRRPLGLPLPAPAEADRR